MDVTVQVSEDNLVLIEAKMACWGPSDSSFVNVIIFSVFL